MPANVSSDYIYLDYAATAPLCEEAARAMAPYQVPGRVNLAVGGNANSLHSPGRAAFEAMEAARKTVARCLERAVPTRSCSRRARRRPTTPSCSAWRRRSATGVDVRARVISRPTSS